MGYILGLYGVFPGPAAGCLSGCIIKRCCYAKRPRFAILLCSLGLPFEPKKFYTPLFVYKS